MCRKLSYLLIPALVLGLAAAVTNAKPLNQDPGPDGIVSVEAEHFDENVPQDGAEWEQVGPTGGFTGEAGMQVADLSSGPTDYAATSPRLDFEVNFVKTGTHYVWILAFGPDDGSDSCHSGLDGQEIDTCDRMSGWNGDYEWNNGTMDPERASFEVTTLGLHTLNVYMREDELIVDKIVLTTNPDYTPTGDGPPESSRGPRVTAADPNPEDEATDVPRDVILTWTPGAYGARHDVYLGTDEQAVADADTANTTGVFRGRRNTDSYDPPEVLELDQTYYWRIDEVNAPPDTTTETGDVWSFTVEPFAYPIPDAAITARASSQDKATIGPENTTNSSGLDETDLLHSGDVEGNMWLSSGTGVQPTWIEYEFDKVYKLYEMWVWNFNGPWITHFGLKNVKIEYSADGTDYTTLGATHEFAQAPGAPGYEHNAPIDFSGVTAKYVRITANSNWSGGLFDQYGLSEVRFLYIPIRAREPEPDSGATDVDLDVVLGWRVGREVTEHNVYFSDSYKAVANGTAPMETVTEAGYGPLSLDLGKIYFWRVDQINNLAPLATLDGDVWNFRTLDFLAVDDFEGYDIGENQIWYAWRDGLGFGSEETPPYSPGNGTGAEVGDGTTASYTEESVVHGGDKSMPYWYNNNKPDKFKYSEAKMTLTSQRDWTQKDVQALTLWFRGNPAGFVEGPAGTYTMTASGRDIWDASDEFRYAWKQLSGPGSIVTKVLSVEDTDDWAKAGVMIRESLDADSRFAAVYITPGQGCRFQIRATTGTDATSDTSVATQEQMAVTAPYWVKMERTSTGEFNAYYSSDPATDPWHLMVWSPRNIQMTDNVYIGFVLTSHNADAICTGQFSDVQTTGTITSTQWTQQVIGPAVMLSNDPEAMYVAVANSTGTPAVVYHDEADATQIVTWTEWNIDLKEFADQGVDLSDVNSIAIGFGDRDNPQPGGAGKMYFDDIRLYPSRCILSKRSEDFAILDYVEDCVIDYREFEIMAGQWLYEQVNPGRPGDIWFEAEAADTISPPMQIYDDSEAAGGKYIAVEPGNSSGSNPPTDGHATYVFDVPGGTYKILGRTIAPTGNDDSFWARIEGATTQTENDPSGWIKYNIVQSEGWSWGPVRSMDDDDEVVYFTMAAGTYTLEIAYREDGALLDALMITDDLNLDPVALSPLAADLNANEIVDFKDYAILADMWLDEQLWPAP